MNWLDIVIPIVTAFIGYQIGAAIRRWGDWKDNNR